MTESLLPILAITAAALLVVVTGGVVYLTASEWRDRRRQDRDKKGEI
ncbi:MAG: hypothetical protein AAF889_06240 [Cyanobacteria bacterium P01_D01_bin.73]